MIIISHNHFSGMHLHQETRVDLMTSEEQSNVPHTPLSVVPSGKWDFIHGNITPNHILPYYELRGFLLIPLISWFTTVLYHHNSRFCKSWLLPEESVTSFQYIIWDKSPRMWVKSLQEPSGIDGLAHHYNTIPLKGNRNQPVPKDVMRHLLLFACVILYNRLFTNE